MIGCLRTRVRKQPIIALYFESELVLKFYYLKARAEDANHYQVQKVGISCFYLYSCIFVFIIRNDSSSAILRKPRNDKIYTCISILCHSCFDLARSVMNGAGFWTES